MLEWFITIPGILILCGVILLVIAIILFIAGTKKSKKEGKISENTEINNEPVAGDSIDIAPIAAVAVEAVEEVNNMVDAINNEKVINEVEEPIKVEEPVVSEVDEVKVPTFAEVSEPVIEDTVVNIPVTEDVAMATPEVVEINEPVADFNAYGGEIPNASFNVEEEKPVTIYGGNDPLEATQTLPKMEEHHEPYGGIYPEVKIVEPTVEPVIETPVEDTVTAMPVFEPTPVVEPISIPEPVVSEVPEIEVPTVAVEETNVEPVSEPVIMQPEIAPVVENNEQSPSVVEEL